MALWILAALLLVLALLYLIASFFFRYTFSRFEKPEPWMSAEEDHVLKDRAFFERGDRELLTITSRDGLKLKAYFYDRGADTTVILCHGYHGVPAEMTGIASRVWEHGMNVLLIYQRAHGLSEGATFTMGGREKLDVVDWAREIARRKPDGKIVLFGWSMGGNSVMGAVGEELPANVVCAIEDCGYENLFEQLCSTCAQRMPKLPAKRLITRLVDLYCRLFQGFRVDEPRREALARCKIPMLFLHGEEDALVPFGDLARCYDACAGEKRRVAFPGAVHVGSCYSNPERYFGEFFDFIDTYV